MGAAAMPPCIAIWWCEHEYLIQSHLEHGDNTLKETEMRVAAMPPCVAIQWHNEMKKVMLQRDMGARIKAVSTLKAGQRLSKTHKSRAAKQVTHAGHSRH